MIAITLQFKSIEAARAALLDIPESALVGAPAPAAKEAPAEAPKSTRASKPAPAAQAPAATSPATAAEPVTAAPVETAASQSSPTTPPAAASSVEYPVLQKAVFQLAGKSREAAAAVAASFGVKTFKELDAARWAEALEAVNAKLAELGA